VDLRDFYNEWERTAENVFTLRLALQRSGCPCNRVPRAMWRLRTRIADRMEAEGHLLTFNPRYELSEDGVGIRCHCCACLVRGLIQKVTADYVLVDFETPVIPTCEECLAEVPY
jgi:hypothetical protein